MIFINGETFKANSGIALAEAVMKVMEICIQCQDGVSTIETEQFNNASMEKKIEIVGANGAVYDIDVCNTVYSEDINN